MAILLAGCGGGGDGPTSPPDAPVISNASTTTVQQQCSTDAGAGTIVLLNFDYSDADGNVRGGRAEVTGSFPAAGPDPITNTFDVPSDTLFTTGTTVGTISLPACVTFGGTSQLTLKIVLFDALNNRSNELTTTVGRPGAAP